MAEPVRFAVLTYRQEGTWYAEVPDLRSGAYAETEAEAIAPALEWISQQRAAT
jgi:predicted RNase H-like HicB family nuclease